jgi:ABC-type phosphate/phosphonate transport system substrate-binding protein
VIASLPMYDRPANAAAHDAFWVLVRDNLRTGGHAAPDTLNRDIAPMAGWGHPDLVLGQICNLPYRAKFRDKVTVIGAADYGLADCPTGQYNSVFIVHKDAVGNTPTDFARARFAANALISHSGYGAPQAWAKEHGFSFPAPMTTGAHDTSLAYVATGRADIAAIDTQTWTMQQRDSAHAKSVRVIGTTASSPGMTFITRAGENPAPYLAAIQTAIRDLSPQDAELLGLRSVIQLPMSDYDLPMPPLPGTIDA